MDRLFCIAIYFSVTIFQPRRENISTWTINVEDLKRWAETELKEKSQLAFSGSGEFKPGSWCTFCRASVLCRARAEEKLKLSEMEFKNPPLLSDEEIETILSIRTKDYFELLEGNEQKISR